MTGRRRARSGRAFVCASLLAAFGPSLSGQEDTALIDGRAFVEVSPDSGNYFVQQRVELIVRFGIETAFIRDHLIQSFRTPLDIPVRVEAPWLEDLPGAILLPRDAPDGDLRISHVLNDRRVESLRVDDREIDGRRFTVVEIRASCLPTGPGELRIPAPALRFSYATRFAEDFLGGRVPQDTRQGEVAGDPVTLAIAALPEAGRPESFTGAVGRFILRAGIDSGDLVVGESFKLTLHIEGRGNLAHFQVPPIEPLPGFHVFGQIEDLGTDRRTVTFDLAPLDAGVTEIPSISLPYFDPGSPPEYRIARTEPIPVSVRPDPDAVSAPEDPAGPVPGDDDIHDLAPVEGPAAEPGRSLAPLVVVAALLAPWLVVLIAFYLRRVRSRNQVDPADLRAREAAARFRAEVGNPDTRLDQALTGFLAANLRCAPAAVVAPQLQTRLERAGIPRDLAAETAGLLDALVDARFGGAPAPAGADAAQRLVDQLHAAFRAAETAR